MTKLRTSRQLTRWSRRGATMLEAVVAATLLLLVMSFVSSLIFRIDLVWRDTTHQRVAMTELSNQLERLTLLSPDDLAKAITSLKPSDSASITLPESKLSGRLIEDQWGRRIVLQLDWQRPHPGKPVQLSGWIHTEFQKGATDETN